MNNMKVRIVFLIYSRVDCVDKPQWSVPVYGIITTSSVCLLLSHQDRLSNKQTCLSPYVQFCKVTLRKWQKVEFILVINQLDAQNLFYNKFISCLYMFLAPCSHRQEVKIVLYSLWYHHTEINAWSKITKITKITKIYKYEHTVVKFMCEFFGCDYCVLLTKNVLWRV